MMRRRRIVLLTGLWVLWSAASALASELETTGGARGSWFAQVQQDLAEREYHVSFQQKSAVEGLAPAYQAPNRAQNLRSYFKEQGVTIIAREAEQPSWSLALSLAGYGRGARQAPLGTPTLRAEGARITYDRGALKEWYENQPRGLEQGFTIDAAPPGTGELWVALALSSGWKAVGSEGRLELRNPGGEVQLNYGELKVGDAAGTVVPARLAVKKGLIRIEIDDRGATYPLVVDPVLSRPPWTAECNWAGAAFGYSVSTAGDVNKDGYADVMLGARYYHKGQTNEGRVFVHYGSQTGLGPLDHPSAYLPSTPRRK
jgi:hypothetical protein